MPRRGYWIIIVASAPTAFRAREPERLLPTLRQLQRTQPTAEMRWFDGHRFWAGPAAAEAAARERRQTPKRPPTWRPGGEHRDPREQFKLTRDQKRARFKHRQRWQEEGRGAEGKGQKAEGKGQRAEDRGQKDVRRAHWSPSAPGKGRHGGSGDKPRGARPWGGKPRGDKPRGDRPPGARPWRDRPHGAGPASGKPRGPFGRKPPKGRK